MGFGSGEVMAPIVRIWLNDKPISTVDRSQVPLDRLWTVAFDEHPKIRFEDAEGISYAHDIPASSGWLHLGVTIQANLACLSTAVASPREARDPKARIENDEIAVRFQPFFLAGADDVPDLTGQGLFARGLHFGGIITPSSILLSCRCDACSQSFLCRSFHTGWGGETYFYSASGRFTLAAKTWVGATRKGMSEPDYATMQALEDALPVAPDGTTFSYNNPFRCPHCAAAYIDFEAHPGLHEREYYGLRLDDTPLTWFS